MAKKILLVEDHADIRNMMVTYLQLNKYEVIEASNGYDAIQQALNHKPDIILMDIAMPVLDGISSTRAMRENDELAQIPIVCLTAYGEFYRERAKLAGCNDVLQKPIDFRKLDALLWQHTQ
ncbi:MAG: response regulator [Pyrinomonadaceae bacterium]